MCLSACARIKTRIDVCESHQCYVTVVPRVVIDQRGPVGHAGYLVPVVPPRHDAGVLVCILPQPVVGLPEVIQDVARPNGGNGVDRYHG